MFPWVTEIESEGKKKMKENKKNYRKPKNNLSQASVFSLMPVPSDKQHEAEINRNKWLLLLLSAVRTRVQLPPRTDFLDILNELRLARKYEPRSIWLLFPLVPLRWVRCLFIKWAFQKSRSVFSVIAQLTFLHPKKIKRGGNSYFSFYL